MFGLGPMELILVGVSACFSFVVPIVVILLLIRLISIKEKDDRRPGP